MPSIQGHFEPEFASVVQQLQGLLSEPQQRGAGLCVYHQGYCVIDVWGGVADRAGREPWQEDTLVNLFSSGKPVLAVVVLQLVQEGKLALDTEVAEYWPEFAAAGKGEITVRQLLAHRSGVSALGESLPSESLYDWQRMVTALEQQLPWWQPDTAHGYAPMTYGWLLGELVRRVEGCMPGAAIARRIAEPLGLELFVGLMAEQLPRVSDVSRIKDAMGDEVAQRLYQRMLQPKTLTGKAFTNPPSMLTSTNKTEWRTMQQPAANAHGDARALAGFYQGLLQGQLLSAELLQEMQREHSLGLDRTLLAHTRFGLGCMLEQSEHEFASYGLGPRAFGHPGAGGTLGCVDPDLQLAVGFVTNSMDAYVLMDPRIQALNRSIKSCL